MTATLDKKQKEIVAEIPSVSDFSSIYFYTVSSGDDHAYMMILDRVVGLNDTVLADWLNITTRTLRNYKNNNELVLKDNLKEHIILIIALYKHGVEVFETNEKFEQWLATENLLLDHKKPVAFLDTISGIRFIDNRLTALEYGENV